MWRSDFFVVDEMMKDPKYNYDVKWMKKYTLQDTTFDKRINEEGCTATVVLIAKGRMYCANAGDSRTVLNRAGKAIPLSTDHKPDLPDEKFRIRTANGVVMHGRLDLNLSLSRAFGDHQFKDDWAFTADW